MSTTRLQRDVYSHLLSELEQSGVTERQLHEHVREVCYDNSPVHILEAASTLSGNPTFALQLGQRITIDSYDTFGFALMSCANLRESIELLTRYGNAFFEPGWTSETKEHGLVVRLKPLRGTDSQQRIVTELCFSQISAIGTSLYRNQLDGVEVHFQHPRPLHARRYQSSLNAEVYFAAAHSELFLPAKLLDTPVKSANKSDHVVFLQQCKALLADMGNAEMTTTAVRQCLIQSAGEFLDINQTAKRMNMSERTLRRRLEAEATSYRKIFTEGRDLLAKENLARTNLTVAEIAHLLGYSETVNFRRAFVRWNKTTPIEYRQTNVI